MIAATWVFPYETAAAWSAPHDTTRVILLLTFTLTMATTKTRKPRADCFYTRDERNVMGPFKEEYRSQDTATARSHIFKSKILLALFNHWMNDGENKISSGEERERVKVRPAHQCMKYSNIHVGTRKMSCQ